MPILKLSVDQTGCHTRYKDPIIQFKTKFQVDINVQKTDAFISLEIDFLIGGMCVLNKKYVKKFLHI